MHLQLTKALPVTTVKPVGLFTMLRTWNEVFRQRQHLAKLDATALADVGLSQTQAQQEARKPAWDLPATWQRSC